MCGHGVDHEGQSGLFYPFPPGLRDPTIVEEIVEGPILTSVLLLEHPYLFGTGE